MSKSAQIVVRVEPHIKRRLAAFAKRTKISVGEAVRILLEGAVQKWGGK